MSANNGQRARFHINRKRRVIRQQHLRQVLADLVKKKADAAAQGAAEPAVVKADAQK
jgi:hypothetical protein